MGDEARTDYKLPKTVRLTVGICYLSNHFKPSNEGTVARAVDMLAKHNLELDVWPYGGGKVSEVNTIKFDKHLVAPEDYNGLYKKVKAILNARCSFVVPLTVLYCNYYGPAYGLTVPISGALTPLVLISPEVNDDKVTLLHEMGHAAGIDHDKYSTTPKNFMREDEPRTTVFKWQVQKFAKASFSVA
jgi:hypothetical protein